MSVEGRAGDSIKKGLIGNASWYLIGVKRNMNELHKLLGKL